MFMPESEPPLLPPPERPGAGFLAAPLDAGGGRIAVLNRGGGAHGGCFAGGSRATGDRDAARSGSQGVYADLLRCSGSVEGERTAQTALRGRGISLHVVQRGRERGQLADRRKRGPKGSGKADRIAGRRGPDSCSTGGGARVGQKDQVATSDLVAPLGPGITRDPTVRELLDHMAEHYSDRAFAQALPFKEGNLQREQAMRVPGHWVPENPVTVIKRIDALPDEVRAGFKQPAAEPRNPRMDQVVAAHPRNVAKGQISHYRKFYRKCILFLIYMVFVEQYRQKL